MRSSTHDLLPPGLRRSLLKFGADLARARRKRHLTAAMLCERIGVAKSTYTRMEKGDPSVALGAYAMALFVLGLGDTFGELLDARRDEQGLLMDDDRLPQRVRLRKTPAAL